MNRIFGAALLLAFAFIIWQQAQIQSEIKDLRQSMLTANLSPPTITPAAGSTQNKLDDLHRELVQLQEQVAISATIPTPVAEARLDQNPLDDEEPRSFSPVIDNTLALGVLDNNAWVEMEADVSKMSKEENRAFWIQVFGGIERGELQVVSPADDAQ